jgi:hypothetical protein
MLKLNIKILLISALLISCCVDGHQNALIPLYITENIRTDKVRSIPQTYHDVHDDNILTCIFVSPPQRLGSWGLT